MSATLTDLLAALTGVPDLPGARCKGHAALFDPARQGEDVPQVEHRHRVAVQTCADCPALTACAAWVDSLRPRDRPPGVIAATIRRERKDCAA